MRRHDAIVIGAGPAGATAAALLARAGWRVAVLEKQRFPRQKVCGECIAASNLPLLDALGVGDAVIARAGPPLRQVALLHGDDAVTGPLPAAAHPVHRYGRALGRDVLDTLLAERARHDGAQVLERHAVLAIDGRSGDWRCTARRLDAAADSTLMLRAPLLIAAHGSWEPLPGERDLRRRARAASDLFAFKACFADASLAPGLLPVLAFDGGYGGMVVANDGLLTLAGCVRADRLETIRRQHPGLRAGEAVEALLRAECRGVREALAGARRTGAWLAAGPIAPGIRLRRRGAAAPHAVDTTLFRIGNAAGEAHPIIGEGISMALQSAALLAQTLLAAAPGGDVLSSAGQRDAAARYADAWHRAFATRLRLAAALAHLAMRPRPAAPLMTLARAWPSLLTWGARGGGKVRNAVPSFPTARTSP